MAERAERVVRPKVVAGRGRMYPRFYLARLPGGFLLHLWGAFIAYSREGVDA